MKKAKDALISESHFDDVNSIFKLTGMTMLNTMGGASGVIFGSMFFGGTKGLLPAPVLDGMMFTNIMRGSLDSIKARGKAQVGDKTMVDALEPAVLAMENDSKENLCLLLLTASEAADQGLENSKKYIAKLGRAKSLMERAVGYQDAGATSVSIIFHAIHHYLETISS